MVCFVLVLVVGVFLRFLVMFRGHNFDFDSYKIVGDIADGLGNVYDQTTRYNYGPVWLTILGLFHAIATIFGEYQDMVFRVLIVGLLTATDIAIALILRKKFGLIAFIVFFLNPVSIIITGFHNQFDNLAVLVGLLGMLAMPPVGAKTLQRGHIKAAIIIGLSLMIKHIFFILPLWLFIREKNLKIKLFMLFVPLTMFGLSFVPFAFSGLDGILNNVFLYKSFANAPLLNALFSQGIVHLVSPMLFFLAALITTGFLTRKLPMLEAGMWYLLVLVAFSPAIANQYLAIAMPAVAALGFIFFIPYIILSTLLITVTDISGMHIQRFADNIPHKLIGYIGSGEYKAVIFSLFIGLVLLAIFRYRKNWYRGVYNRIRLITQEQLESITSYRASYRSKKRKRSHATTR